MPAKIITSQICGIRSWPARCGHCYIHAWIRVSNAGIDPATSPLLDINGICEEKPKHLSLSGWMTRLNSAAPHEWRIGNKSSHAFHLLVVLISFINPFIAWTTQETGRLLTISGNYGRFVCPLLTFAKYLQGYYKVCNFTHLYVYQKYSQKCNLSFMSVS